jgi:hypothetical protein
MFGSEVLLKASSPTEVAIVPHPATAFAEARNNVVPNRSISHANDIIRHCHRDRAGRKRRIRTIDQPDRRV